VEKLYSLIERKRRSSTRARGLSNCFAPPLPFEHSGHPLEDLTPAASRVEPSKTDQIRSSSLIFRRQVVTDRLVLVRGVSLEGFASILILFSRSIYSGSRPPMERIHVVLLRREYSVEGVGWGLVRSLALSLSFLLLVRGRVADSHFLDSPEQ